jgi:uncharacterized protein (TIGR02452 family)
MDIQRLENLHLADEILNLMETKYTHLKPLSSVKFTKDIFKIKPRQETLCEETDIEIENTDTVTATLRECAAGYRVLVLNMANAEQPGGGFSRGAKAQEEDLFRCSNLSKTLTEDLYPMLGTDIIYSPKVHILRDAKYNNIEDPPEVGFVSIAAHQNPYVNPHGMLSNSIYDITKCKIHMMFHLGLIQKYDCLVLGALGCGAFNNPPHEIAKMFCEICSIYAQQFKRIIFAVMSNTGNDNCHIFQQAFLDTFNTSDNTMRLDLEHDPNVLYNHINERYERTSKTRYWNLGRESSDRSRLKSLGKYLIYQSWQKKLPQSQWADPYTDDPELETLKLAMDGDIDPDDIDSSIWETLPDAIDNIMEEPDFHDSTEPSFPPQT